MNRLFYGDNLDVLRRHIPDESVDLVYLDPPFNSNANYNVLFAERDGTRAAAQIRAFEDTWRWDDSAARAYQETVEMGGRVSQAMQAFRNVLGESDMLAYLSMMAPRLLELRRVLKTTGSIYLHCDPTASHYLKMLMDGIFGPVNLRNEIIWQRTLSKGLTTRALADNHDVILSYKKSDEAKWLTDSAFLPYDPANLDEKTRQKYSLLDADGRRYQLTSLLNPNQHRPNLTYEFLGVTRVWRWEQKRMHEAYKAGLVVQPSRGAVPRYKRYLDEQRGRPIGDVWTDIPPLNSQAKERLGYPTQKPEALLERLLSTCTDEGDVVLDPFCGCGTAIATAHKMRRRWIGVDITHLAIGLIRHRLQDAHGQSIENSYRVIGEPISLPDAEALARSDPYQFQWWTLGLLGGRPTEEKRGADKGVDGRIFLHERAGGETKQIILSVKAGHAGPNHLSELRGVMERDGAIIGVLITMQEPTKAMLREAASGGFYDSMWGRHPRLQILTVPELLAGRRIDCPPIRQTGTTYRRAPRVVAPQPKQASLYEIESPSATQGTSLAKRQLKARLEATVTTERSKGRR